MLAPESQERFAAKFIHGALPEGKPMKALARIATSKKPDGIAEPKPNQVKERFDFLPDLLEIQERPPHPASRVGIGLLVSFVTIGLTWASLGKIDIMATATGSLIPEGQTWVVQASVAGSVSRYHVHEGAEVSAGQLLMSLDDTDSKAGREAIEAQLKETQNNQARIAATLAILTVDSAVPPKDRVKTGDLNNPGSVAHPLLARLTPAQRSRLRAQIAAYQAQQQDLEYNRQAKTHLLGQTRMQIEKYEKVLPLLEEQGQALKILMEKALGARQQWLQLEQQIIEARQELHISRIKAKELQAETARLEAQKNQLRESTREALLDQQQQNAERIQVLTQDRIKAARNLKQHRILAPIDGTVQELRVHTEGAVVTPAQTLLRLVPKDTALQANIQLLNKDIGYVSVGQEVEVKVDTYPFTRYGVITGTLIRIDRDTSQNPGNATPLADPAQAAALQYQARIHLNEQHLTRNGKTYPLGPGMTVTAEIRTGERRIIDFLFAPILEHLDEGLRER